MIVYDYMQVIADIITIYWFKYHNLISIMSAVFRLDEMYIK